VDFMADQERHQPRPLWVRLMARPGTKRRAALRQALIFGIVLCSGLAFAAIVSASASRSGPPPNGFAGLLYDAIAPAESILHPIGLALELAVACLGAAGALWTWLAVRWVDRNGKWAQ
jgi:hypothetical protein